MIVYKFSIKVFIISFLFEFSSDIFFASTIKFVFSICSVLTRSILLLKLYNSSMMKILMTITSSVKLHMDFVMLSKLISKFEKVSIVVVLHSLFISGSVSESITSFILFSKYHIIFKSLLALGLSTKINLQGLLVFHWCNFHLCLMPMY